MMLLIFAARSSLISFHARSKLANLNDEFRQCFDDDITKSCPILQHKTNSASVSVWISTHVEFAKVDRIYRVANQAYPRPRRPTKLP